MKLRKYLEFWRQRGLSQSSQRFSDKLEAAIKSKYTSLLQDEEKSIRHTSSKISTRKDMQISGASKEVFAEMATFLGLKPENHEAIDAFVTLYLFVRADERDQLCKEMQLLGLNDVIKELEEDDRVST